MFSDFRQAFSGDFKGMLVASFCLFALGMAAGAMVKRCQHDRGECEHVAERAEVEAVLDCLRHAGR